MEYVVTIHRTTFTENEVFGTGCGDCGFDDFSASTPTKCEKCGSSNLNPADGCELPYDDNHTETETETVDSVKYLARLLWDNGCTQFDGNNSFSNPDGSTIIDYGTGEREEVTMHVSADMDAPLVSLACDNALRHILVALGN